MLFLTSPSPPSRFCSVSPSRPTEQTLSCLASPSIGCPLILPPLSFPLSGQPNGHHSRAPLGPYGGHQPPRLHNRGEGASRVAGLLAFLHLPTHFNPPFFPILKVFIAEQYLIPKQLAANGLSPEHVIVTPR